MVDYTMSDAKPYHLMAASERAASMVGGRVIVKRGNDSLKGIVGVVTSARVSPRGVILVTVAGSELPAKRCDVF